MSEDGGGLEEEVQSIYCRRIMRMPGVSAHDWQTLTGRIHLNPSLSVVLLFGGFDILIGRDHTHTHRSLAILLGTALSPFYSLLSTCLWSFSRSSPFFQP